MKAFGEKASVSALVSKRSIEIRDFDETVEKKEVMVWHGMALGRPAFIGSCRLFTRFSGVKIAVIQLTEADAAHLLQLGEMRIGCVECRIREHPGVARCFQCLGYGHMSRGCGNPDRKGACWRCGATGHVANCVIF